MKDRQFFVRLLRWAESHASGRTVTFQLSDDEPEHPFKGFPTGTKSGQKMSVTVSALGDGEGEDPVRKRETLGLPAGGAPPGAEGKSLADVLARFATRAGGAAGAEPPPQPPPQAQAAAGDAAGESTRVVNLSQAPAPAEAPAAPPAEPAASAGAQPATVPPIIVIGGGGGGGGGDEGGGDGGGDGGKSSEGPPPEPSPREHPTVVKAIKLCKSVDKHHAAFFYYMKEKYPEVPNLPTKHEWSRDAKATRDRVCHTLRIDTLEELSENEEARRRLDSLESTFVNQQRARWML